jgi:hypothetical protein
LKKAEKLDDAGWGKAKHGGNISAEQIFVDEVQLKSGS